MEKYKGDEVTSVLDCQQKCEKNPECTSFAYYAPLFEDSSQRECRLRKEFDYKTIDNGNAAEYRLFDTTKAHSWFAGPPKCTRKTGQECDYLKNF